MMITMHHIVSFSLLILVLISCSSVILARGTTIGSVHGDEDTQEEYYSDDRLNEASVFSSPLEQSRCIGDYRHLKHSLENAANGDTFLLCPGTIDVLDEIRVTAKNIRIFCERAPRSCILNKHRGMPGRIFDFSGGGIKLRGIQFWNATGSGDGGAVRISGFTGNHIINCRFVANKASGSGGGLYINVEHACQDKIEYSEFINNKASGDGGGFARESQIDCRMACPFSLHSAVFVNNKARRYGGAAYGADGCQEGNLLYGNVADSRCNGFGRSTFQGDIIC